MAQAWHKRGVGPVAILDSALNAKATRWRATDYEVVGDLDSRAVRGVTGQPVIEAAQGATWERFSPFDSYRATAKARTLEAGPHLTFLWLKRLWEEHRDGQFRLPNKSLRQTEWFRKHLSQTGAVREILEQSGVFRKALILFAREYGFLGLFEEDFPGKPVLPRSKTLIAPEAFIDGRGRLRRVEPATKGKELLLEALAPAGHFSAGHSPRPLNDLERRSAYGTMALPSEARFESGAPRLGGTEPPLEPRRLESWEGIRKHFGALVLLDDRAADGVSILCTREPLRRWEVAFRFFPSSAPEGDVVLDDDSYVFLNSFLADVSPRALVGKGGNLERGWRYRSLLQAMYLMLYLDLTGGNTIKKCLSRGCPNYFRQGPQGRSKFCSRACANLASTRRGRGQTP